MATIKQIDISPMSYKNLVVPNFAKMLNLKHQLIVAPMAGGPSSPELVAATSKAGALGSIGAAYSSPEMISDFVKKVRQMTDRPFAINLFIPHPEPVISQIELDKVIAATATYRQELDLPEPNLAPPYEEDFDAQFEAALRARPAVISFIFGLLPRQYLKAAKAEKIFLIGTATTLDDAKAQQESGIDAVVLQGVEAGGHRGIFDAEAKDAEIKTFELLKQCLPEIKIPIIAAGGIMTSANIKKALEMGAQAVQMGTAFLACKEAGTSAAYKAKLLENDTRETKTTRVFSGRLARGIKNRFMNEMENNNSAILPFPAQNKFTRDLRNASAVKNSPDFLSLWSGTGNGALWQGPAAELIEGLYRSLQAKNPKL